MSIKPHTQSSPLFLVRLWSDEDGNTEATSPRTARGKVLHVVSGEASYFEDWAELIALMKTMLSNHQADTSWSDSTAPERTGPASTDQGS